jgi:hypothetical protein
MEGTTQTATNRISRPPTQVDVVHQNQYHINLEAEDWVGKTAEIMKELFDLKHKEHSFRYRRPSGFSLKTQVKSQNTRGVILVDSQLGSP